MDRVIRGVALLGAVAVAQVAAGGPLSSPDDVFVGTTANWTSVSADSGGESSSNVLLTQADSGGGSPTWALVAPYVWLPMADGTIGANGNTADVNVSFSDLMDLLPDLNGALMGHVEVGNGPRGLLFDALFLELSPSRRGPLGGKIQTTSELAIIEALGTLRLIGAAPGEGPPSDFAFDILGGLRYYDVNGEIRVVPVQGPTVTNAQSENWVDLVIGARTRVVLTDSLSGFVRGDIAGYSIGTSSQLTWNLQAGLEYACASHPGWSASLGYKILDIDEVKYSGAERFVFDVRLHGPFVALIYRF